MPIKRVIGIGHALTAMLVNMKTDSVLARFHPPKRPMSLVAPPPQTELPK